MSDEEKEWNNKLMADVDEFLYVRKSADADSEIVGKMYKGDRAVIKDEGSEWTKIASGNVKRICEERLLRDRSESICICQEKL